jgi:predicted hydrocarbon binding protein
MSMVKPAPISSARASQMIIRGIQDILGLESTRALLGLAKVPYTQEDDQIILQQDLSSQNLGIIQTFLEAIYGSNSGQGIILRAGRTFFDDLLREYGNQIGIMDTDLRTLPTRKRIRAGLDLLAEVIGGTFHIRVIVSDDQDNWFWQVEDCPWCLHREGSGRALCVFDTGLLQAYLSWTTGGKAFVIHEAECRAAGSSHCLTRIEKDSLG